MWRSKVGCPADGRAVARSFRQHCTLTLQSFGWERLESFIMSIQSGLSTRCSKVEWQTTDIRACG